MPYYKTPDGALHFLSADDIAKAGVALLPIDAMAISDTEAATLVPKPDPRGPILARIAETEATITPRRLREAMLSGDHSFIEAVDAKIAALRKDL